MQHLMPHKQLIASVVFLLAIAAPSTWAQENAQLQIPPSLVECYNTSYYMNRDNRLPSTINTLIDLIRKVENSPDFNMDARQLSVALLHRFRQDGIQRAPGVQAVPGVLPYSPTGFQFPKFRILLSRLIQGNANSFPNSSLTQMERCSMHFMLSSSYNLRVRGDENTVCNRLSQYRSNRLARSVVNDKPYKSNFLADVEFIETHKNSKKTDKVKTNSYTDFDYWNDGDVSYGNDNSVSQCPVENGVIWTPWGSVSAGNLLAGIAAGYQPQTIQLKTLLALSRRPGQFGGRQSTLSVDNRWAATLAGDLAEVALVQVPMSPSNSASVGAGGTWNDTVMAKWYFMSQRDKLEMTDAEIRGDLDGLIMAMNINDWKNQASGMRLSQLLSMYYSLGGVLNSGIMACNRQKQFNTITSTSDMSSQTAAFAQVLDAEMQLRVTLQQPAIQQFSQSAASELANYIPQYLNDISCQASSIQTNNDVSDKIIPMTDIFVYLDTSWEYNTIVSYVSNVLEGINIGPYASSVTVLCAGDGRVLVNTTNQRCDVYQQWNVTTQSQCSPGFNLPLILKSVQNLTQTIMNEEKRNNSVGGRSMVALLVPNMATVNDGDSNYVQIQLQYIYEQIPDLKFIYFTGGSPIRFNSFVVDPSKDIFSISMGQNNAPSQGRPVIERIKEIQRRIINPRCGSSWYTSTWGQDQMYQYIRPNHINFYRLMPNYFYTAGGSRQVSVNGASGTTLTVCTSRYAQRPMQNATTSTNGQSDVSCKQLTNTGGSMTYDLSNACNGYYTIKSCPPLYISVQATSSFGSQASCIENACQFPDEVRYQVTVQNLGCNSGVEMILANLTVVIMAAILKKIIE